MNYCCVLVSFVDLALLYAAIDFFTFSTPKWRNICTSTPELFGRIGEIAK
jgi:hypothetical protein